MNLPDTKSLSSAVTDAEALVSIRNDAKHGLTPGRHATSIPPSKNAPVPNTPDGPLLGLKVHGDDVLPGFVMAKAADDDSGRESRTPSEPPLPTHLKARMTAVPPPWMKLERTSKSPTSCVPVKRLLLGLGCTVAFKNQKPIWAFPLVANLSPKK